MGWVRQGQSQFKLQVGFKLRQPFEVLEDGSSSSTSANARLYNNGGVINCVYSEMCHACAAWGIPMPYLTLQVGLASIREKILPSFSFGKYLRCCDGDLGMRKS